MGVVYGASDIRLNRPVALKFLPASIEADEERKRRFLQEAKAASALDHPNICTIHQIDETDDGQMFIVMSYYKGETLKAKIDRGRLPLEEALQFAAQIARGLAKARQAGIVHRDIKPANIIVTTDGVVKILDFGLALLVEETKMTAPGSLLGTPAYMSPEQAHGGEVNHRTDIWALGVVLYEMVSGQRPFKGEYQSAIIYSLLHEDPAPLTDLPREVSVGLNRAISKALAKAPGERYQDVEEMLADLQAVSKRLEGGASTLLPEEEKPRNKRLVPIYGAGAALIVVVLAAVFYLNRNQQSGSLAEREATPSPPASVAQQQAPSEESREVQPDGPSLAAGTQVPPPPERPAPSQPPVAQSQPRVAQNRPRVEAQGQPPAVQNPPRLERAEAQGQPRGQEEEAPPPARESPPVAAPRGEPVSPEESTQAVTPRPAPESAPPATERDPPPSELADWARIRSSADIGVFEDFLRKHPDGVLRAEATNRIENLRWEAARTSGDPAAVRAYLQQHPGGRYAEQARALIAPAPSAPQPRPPNGGSQTDEAEAIRGVIRNFAAAYERRDAKAIAALWPSLQPDQLASITSSFREARSIRYELKPVSDPEIADGKATMRFMRSVQFEFAGSPPKPVQDDVTFSLRKRGTAWVIEQVSTR